MKWQMARMTASKKLRMGRKETSFTVELKRNMSSTNTQKGMPSVGLLSYYAHHGEVIVGFGTVTMTIYFLGQCLNNLFCRTEMHLTKDV